jgi:SAM-dependent methyltransferase
MQHEHEHEDHHGVLMRGLGRWLVYSRPRAWLGMAVEVPGLLRGVDIPRGARCLDIATGLGWATVGLARRDSSARIVALDYDGTILPRAREYLGTHGAAASAALCRADGKRLPFRDGSFDLVLCLYGLHHFRGYLDALREIARVLKPSGTFALIDPIRRPRKPPGGHHGTQVPTREELDRMLGDAGFEIERSRISMGTVKAVTHKAGHSTGQGQI